MRLVERLRERQRVWTKRLERPLRIDAASHERRTARLGERALQRLTACGVVAGLTINVAVPVWELADGGPWERGAAVATGVATVVLVAAWTVLYRAGR